MLKLFQSRLKPALWILSFLVTVLVAYYQRLTGPTYPVKDEMAFERGTFVYYLPRSCVIGKKCAAELKLRSPKSKADFSGIKIVFSHRRHKSFDKWSSEEFRPRSGFLECDLPPQPSGGKLEYRLAVFDEKAGFLFETPLIISRFRNDVPARVLIPHIFFIFLFLFFTSRIFFGFFERGYVFKHAVFLNLAFLVLGGFVFGPISQQYAFGEYWTGFPFGMDLTDNKTFIMLVFWIIAAWSVFRENKSRKFWLFFAFLITFVVYFIPHSFWGTEIDYTK